MEVNLLSYQCFLVYEKIIFRVNPITKYEPKLSGAVFATCIHFEINSTYIITITLHTIKPNSSPITEKIKSVVLGYRYPKCVCVPCIKPSPKSPPAPIAILDCIILYPSPLGSLFGSKYTSILAFACSGKTNKYNSGTSITTNVIETIIYLLSIPATNKINISANIYAVAVP